MMFFKSVLIGAGFYSALATANPVGESPATTLARLAELAQKGEHDSVVRRLAGDSGKLLASAQLEPLALWLKARSLEALGRKDEAAADYAKAMEKKSSFEAQLLFAAGRFHARSAQLDKAAEYLKPIAIAVRSKRLPASTVYEDAPAPLRLRAILEMAKVLAEQKKWREVDALVQPALRSARGQEIYPTMVFALVRAKLMLGRSDCRLARELFAKYPALPEVGSWGPLLPQNAIDSKNLSCSATSKDIQTRLKRLQLAGQIDRSITEIGTLRAKGVFDQWTTDSFEVNALLGSGQNDAALKRLLVHADEQKLRPAFWMLFGKVTSRLGDLTASASAYKRAYDLAPRSRAASDALFSSAFASYQMQDYDGAKEGFSLLSRRYGRAKVARDARWHLAWMNYLRGEYESALSQWQALLKERGRRGRTDATAPDRIRYWSAAALMRLGRTAEATEHYRQLLRDPAIDYYAILAWYRLKGIPGVKLSESEVRLGFKRHIEEKELSETVAAEATEVAKDIAENSPAASEEAADDDEATPEAAAEAAATDAPAAATGEGAEPLSPEVAALLAPVAGSVRDQALNRRLERVRLMFASGLTEETQWELKNLDAKVRHPQDRRLMMAELHRMGRWDRSSTIAELAFGTQRLRGGFDGARELWEYAYPKAWSPAVGASARSAGVDDDLVLSIMRAESHFRPEARSPVGASGLMQIMPFTAEKISKELLGHKSFDPTELFDPETNIKLGARYLRRLQEKSGSSLPLIAASYNAGPHRVQTWLKGFGALRMDEFIEHIPFVETRNYVKKVARNFQIYRSLYRDDRGALGWLIQPVGVTPDRSPGAQEVW